jgi:hypothetical protein
MRAELKSGNVIQRENVCFEIHQAGRIWLISSDCRSVFRSSDQRASLGGPDAGEGVEISRRPIPAVRSDRSAGDGKRCKIALHGREVVNDSACVPVLDTF